jgi:SAM-dependent methyltransferase
MSESPSVHRAAAEGFASGAETYVRGRPDYPPQALEWLRKEIGLGVGKTVVDLGAGTGKFTKVLLTTGAKVIAVDPVMPMLDRLRRELAGSPQSPGGSESRSAESGGSLLTAVAGTAEKIPVASGSVDAVVCAQSFHWFATPAAVAEIHRVLKPGGVFGLIWNQRDESVSWVADLNQMLARYQGDAPRMISGEWRKVFPAPGFGPLHESHFPHAHIGAPDRVIIDRFMSVSFIAALSAADREQVLTQLRDLIARTPSLAGRSEVSVPYVTVAFHCRKTTAGSAA